jgi:hypothetical protein
MYKRRGVGKGAGQQNGPRNMDLLEIGTGRTAEVEERMGREGGVTELTSGHQG